MPNRVTVIHDATVKPTVHHHRRSPLRDWRGLLIALLGVWLICVPWVLAPAVGPLNGPLKLRIGVAIASADWANWICGGLIVLVGLLAALLRPRLAWIAIVLGAVIFAVPWFCGLLGPSAAVTPPGQVMTGFALLFFVLPGAGGLLWNCWLTGAAAMLVSLWAGLHARHRTA